MKTAEEVLKEEWAWENPVHAFRDGYNAAIEAMRAESEPVAWVTEIADGREIYVSDPPNYAIAIYTHPQPLRELSRDDVTELWHQATQEEGGIGKVVERFAKLVREVK